MDCTVLKFNHCGRKIYSFDKNMRQTENTGRKCPICQEQMRFSLLEAPVIVPCPFSNGHKVRCAFLIGSSLGPAFLSEWQDSELHVGVTNSQGVVYSYTSSGVQREEQGWEQCLCVPLVAPGTSGGSLAGILWDSELEQFSRFPTWSQHRFEEEREFGSCCYGFALSFLNQLRRAEGRESVTRDDFTQQHVLPHVKTASKYITVYQEIHQQGFYVADL
ncbi:MKRN2 opposite strand, tandem duplicate 1 [Oncorhynchus tshawytscha]|uniref:MKRN2 opposite strand protein-like C-terminal domain-containing protein n=1 Tax=Oncorhynchus tshawytscha TaxID=74940 RepID=A0AAZ3PDX6_ONCTS|nr:MKRN2 opposite strand, tandem duplicate 1 [Oncorhynchus tshawytscha]